MSYKYYQAVEAGRKMELRLSTVERLAKAYGLEVHELLALQLPRTKLRKRVVKRADTELGLVEE